MPALPHRLPHRLRRTLPALALLVTAPTLGAFPTAYAAPAAHAGQAGHAAHATDGARSLIAVKRGATGLARQRSAAYGRVARDPRLAALPAAIGDGVRASAKAGQRRIATRVKALRHTDSLNRATALRRKIARESPAQLVKLVAVAHAAATARTPEQLQAALEQARAGSPGALTPLGTTADGLLTQLAGGQSQVTVADGLLDAVAAVLAGLVGTPAGP